MLKRIASTGVNLVVLGVSVGIFLVAFIALNALGAAQKPPTISVLSATRDLNIGDVITANDLVVKTVFQDDNASLYIPGEEVTGVVGGDTWQPVSIKTSGWSYLWHSNEVLNGGYNLQLRGTDRAGNMGDVFSISLTVNNAPPSVSITERWWIWEAGTLKVYSNHFPIATIQVTIRDPHKRWKDVALHFDPGKNSYTVKWDRHFADGTLAPAGEYPVLAVACDVNGVCGQDVGRVVIPETATSTSTLTPSPTATSTLIPSKTPAATQIVPTPTFVPNTPIPEEISDQAQPSFPLWQIIGLFGLFVAITSASVVDPRPKALDRLGETFRVMPAQAKDNSFENKQF